jgi:N-methylhydantoinase A
VRYYGQSFELEIPWTAETNVMNAFHVAHQMRYGYSQRANKVEVVSVRLRSLGIVDELNIGHRIRRSGSRKHTKPQRYAQVYFEVGKTRAAVYARDQLGVGARLHTPCIVTEYSATTLVPTNTRAGIDPEGNLVIDL